MNVLPLSDRFFTSTRAAELPRRWYRSGGAVLAALRERDPVLAACGLAVLLAAVPLLLAQAIDTRTLAGVDVWSKPLKFHLSLGIYALTLAWFGGWISERARTSVAYRGFRALVVACIAFELIVIDGAVAVGTTSHFNETDPLFPNAYPLMGVGAVILTTMSLVQGVLIARNREAALDPVLRLAVVLGLLLTFVLTLVVAGYLSSTGSHLVGGNALDTEAMVLSGWARDGGDLRVAHFFATHAMHALPLLGWLLAPRVRSRIGKALIALAAVAYTALVAQTFLQALAGRPFLALL